MEFDDYLGNDVHFFYCARCMETSQPLPAGAYRLGGEVEWQGDVQTAVGVDARQLATLNDRIGAGRGVPVGSATAHETRMTVRQKADPAGPEVRTPDEAIPPAVRGGNDDSGLWMRRLAVRL